MRSFTTYLVLLSIGLLPSLGVADNARAQQRQQIEQLIQRLGSQQYAERQRAEAELRYQGAVAIEQLLEAQYDKSREISLAAQQILNSLTINWTRPNEHPIIEQILRGYDSLGSSNRLGKVDWLAKLEDGVGFPAVARIVRYESSDVNAKQAALSLIEIFDETQDDQVQSLNKAVEATRGSQRTPLLWLRAFHDEVLANKRFELDDSATEATRARLQTWGKFAEVERNLADSPRTNKAITTAIHRRAATRAMALLKEQSDDPLATQVLDSTVNYLVESNEEPIQFVTLGGWLLDEGQEAIFQKRIWEPQKEKLRKDQSRLVYLAAESYRKTDVEKSEQLAKEAFDIHEPKDEDLDLDIDDLDNFDFVDPLSSAYAQFSTAVALENRGMTEWAIREYRRVMSIESEYSRINFIKKQAAVIMSELLHDRQRDEEAADALAAIADIKTIGIFDRDDEKAAGLEARKQYFRAEHYRQQGDREKQIQHLRKAIKADPTDADVLIAMYRLPRADERWKRETKRKIRAAVQTFETKIQQSKSNGEIANRAEVATNLNQIAWLVGNTEGDYKRAIEQSRRSLELRPHSPGSLDTLGRTYFAAGDIENALKYQRRAAKLEPHTQQIARQLAEFEIAASQGAVPKLKAEQRELQEATP